jgi:5-methylcytosine-specific restriction endonuclease McrA
MANKPSGPDNPAWKGGKSFEPYPTEWTEELKRQIRRRDAFRCFLCGDSPRGRALAIHHVDYQKDNLDPSNLVSLCTSCHAKTNFDRERWRKLISDRMAGKA